MHIISLSSYHEIDLVGINFEKFFEKIKHGKNNFIYYRRNII